VPVVEGSLLTLLFPENLVVAAGVERRVDINQIDTTVR
jgi:hypothetical protein